MPLPPRYKKASEKLVNYTYEDYIASAGYVSFNGFTTKDNAATNYILSNHSFKTATTSTESVSLTFTKTIKTAQRIGGQAFIQVKHDFEGNGNPNTANLTVSVQKNNVELTGATVTGADLTSTGATSRVEILDATVPDTYFGVDDTLDIKITIANSAAGVIVDHSQHIYHDPAETVANTKMQVDIPFRVEE